jgi:hypothetical protein
VGQGLRLHGHGIRLRQLLGPTEAQGEPAALDVPCRRFLCVVCKAVVLVVPGMMLSRRRYSAAAIAQALGLFGLEMLSAAAVRRKTSTDKVLGFAAVASWVTLHRWCDDVRAGRLFPEVRRCPASFTRRQVAERAATTMSSRAPPPPHPSLIVCAFIGAGCVR